jgi:hypothetical protein
LYRGFFALGLRLFFALGLQFPRLHLILSPLIPLTVIFLPLPAETSFSSSESISSEQAAISTELAEFSGAAAFLPVSAKPTAANAVAKIAIIMGYNILFMNTLLLDIALEWLDWRRHLYKNCRSIKWGYREFLSLYP